MTMLSLRNATKRWAGFSLEDITLDIKEGEYFNLLGPTGSGKTLLLEIILGFHELDHGEVFINGRRVNALKPEARGIGYVPQSVALFPHLTVLENITFSQRIRGEDWDTGPYIGDLVNLLGLSGLENRKPHNLSGGEKQKVALARAVVRHPKLLLLDEPLSNIDEEGKRELKVYLKTIHKTLGLTIIHVTHDQQEALSLADRVAVLFNGRLEQVGAPLELYERPATLRLARFMGFENFFELPPKQASTSIIGAEAVLGTNKGKGHAAIRGEDVRVFKERPEELISSRATITSCTLAGPNIIVTLDAGLKIMATLSRHEYDDLQVTEGDELWINIPEDKVRFFD